MRDAASDVLLLEFCGPDTIPMAVNWLPIWLARLMEARSPHIRLKLVIRVEAEALLYGEP